MTKLQLHPEYSYRLIGCEAIREYLAGGQGVVTLKAPSGAYRTYQFRFPKDDEANFKPGTQFIYALCGFQEWQYVGMYVDGRFRLTQASRFSSDHPISKGAAYIVKMMFNETIASGPMVLYHEGICSVCGRPLRTPNSIKAGIGPKCRKRLNLTISE